MRSPAPEGSKAVAGATAAAQTSVQSDAVPVTTQSEAKAIKQGSDAKPAGKARADSLEPAGSAALSDSNAEKGLVQPKGFPPLKKPKHGPKTDGGAKHVQDKSHKADQQDTAHEVHPAADTAAKRERKASRLERIAAKRERKAARKAAGQARAGSLEPAASNATSATLHSSVQATQSASMDSEAAGAEALVQDRQEGSSAEVPQHHEAKPSPVVHNKPAVLSGAAKTVAADKGPCAETPGRSHGHKPSIRAVASQQAHASQQKQSPSPRKQPRQSPGSALASPSVPDLFARHASDLLRTKGAQFEARLAAAADGKSGQHETAADQTTRTRVQPIPEQKAADISAVRGNQPARGLSLAKQAAVVDDELVQGQPAATQAAAVHDKAHQQQKGNAQGQTADQPAANAARQVSTFQSVTVLTNMPDRHFVLMLWFTCLQSPHRPLGCHETDPQQQLSQHNPSRACRAA